jgi:hypothetical protein
MTRTAVIYVVPLSRAVARFLAATSPSKVTCICVPYIASSARKHGISDEDMLHAFRNVIRTEEQDEGFTMFIGPAYDARLLEAGVVDSSDGPVIIHADKARAKYLPGKGGR